MKRLLTVLAILSLPVAALASDFKVEVPAFADGVLKPAQFAGLMGAFGRRVVNTPGYVLNSSFFDYEWDDERSCYLYRLPATSRAAVEKARLVDT